MMHRRRWSLAAAESPEDLGRKLTQHTWTLCTGFYVAGHEDYLFLNDATCEDGAGEWGICKRQPGQTEFVQVESITFSWLTLDAALGQIRRVLAGEFDDNDFATSLNLQVETSGEHERCHLCA